jgi:hypothetical protein
MTFDLYTLDKLEDWDDEFFEQYLCDILLIFDKSPEAQEFSENLKYLKRRKKLKQK